jgi:hypothetical protein
MILYFLVALFLCVKLLLKATYCDGDSFRILLYSRLLANLYLFARCSASYSMSVILYLLSFDFRIIQGYLRFYGAGVSGKRSIVDKKNARKEKPNHNQFIYLLNLSKPRIRQVNRKESQTHDQSLSFKSLIDCSTHASESQGKYRYCRAHLPFLSRLPLSSINANFRKIDASQFQNCTCLIVCYAYRR